MKRIISILLMAMALPLGLQAAQRIVSLAPSLTKMIYLLEAQNQLVGCTSYCEVAQDDHKTIVATAIDVNVEKVFVLKPDLVMATTITKQSTIDALRKLGLNVVVFPTTKSFDEICKQLTEIGAHTGKEKLAQSIISKQNARLKTLRLTIPKTTKPKMFFEIGAKPLFTVIPNTFMNDYITFAGGTNIAGDLKSGTITRESVLMKNPDVIIIVTMGIVGNDEKTTWMSYPQLNAAKTGKIFIVDSEKACSPTPITFVDLVEQLITLIYK